MSDCNCQLHIPLQMYYFQSMVMVRWLSDAAMVRWLSGHGEREGKEKDALVSLTFISSKGVTNGG